MVDHFTIVSQNHGSTIWFKHGMKGGPCQRFGAEPLNFGWLTWQPHGLGKEGERQVGERSGAS